jgi:multiple sugar transport system substrate-binding protein
VVHTSPDPCHCESVRYTGGIRTCQKFLLILILFYFSCNRKNTEPDEALLYWSANNPYEVEFAQAVVSEWNTLFPQTPVYFQPIPEGRSSEEVILAAVVGKTTPDIYSNMWQGDVEFFARAGVLVPLDTMTGFIDSLYQRCDSSVVSEISSQDGHIYQVPWKINPIMLLYNQGLFSEIGFDQPPVTYSQFLKAAEMIKADLNNDGYVDRWIGYSEVLVTWWQRFFDFYPLYLAASNGGKLIDNNRVVFDNAYAIAVFEFLKTLYDRNYFSREVLSARQDVFLSGVIASRFAGPWEIVHAEKFKTAGFTYSFSPLPVPDGHKGGIYTYGDPKNIVIFNTCQRPQQALRFILFLTNKRNDLRLLQMSTQLPRRKKLFTDQQYSEYFQRNPKMIPFALQAQYVRGTDTCPQLKEIFDIISQEYEACVIYGVKQPAQAVHDAARAVQVLLE